MQRQSRLKGIAISYVTTAVRTLSKLLLTPLYLRVLGMDDYGFYQYVFSIACYAMILDFGIGSVVNTFSIRHKEKGDTKGAENVMFYAFMFSVASAFIITIICAALVAGVPVIFGGAVSRRIRLTRQLLVLMTAEIILLIFQHYFEGAILAAERYVTFRGVALIQIILRCTITVFLLYCGAGVFSIALGDLIGVALCLFYEVLYCKFKLELKIRYHYRDEQMLKNIAKLSFAFALQSVVSFLNSSIDKYVLGRCLSTVAVAVYTVAATFSVFFEEIPTVIQRLYLPQVVKLISSGADGEKLTDFVIKPGRYQFMLAGGVLGGFILFGKQFILMWSGEKTLDAWAIALLLMVPSVLPLIQNVCLSVLTAMNKRMFRSLVLCGVAAANLILTVFLVKKYGLMGAPVGTFISTIVGNNIVMNLYYKYVIHINVKKLFRSILKGILPCAAAATAICSLLLLVETKGILWFFAECIVFCVVYGCFLWLFGMNADEKNRISAILRAKLR